MTEREWLQLPDDMLGLELSKALVDGPWKHNFVTTGRGFSETPHCENCGCYCDNLPDAKQPCPFPDPIDITSWDTAMKYFRGTYGSYGATRKAMVSIWAELDDKFDFEGWLMFEVEPKHLMIAVVLIIKENQG